MNASRRRHAVYAVALTGICLASFGCGTTQISAPPGPKVKHDRIVKETPALNVYVRKGERLTVVAIRDAMERKAKAIAACLKARTTQVRPWDYTFTPSFGGTPVLALATASTKLVVPKKFGMEANFVLISIRIELVADDIAIDLKSAVERDALGHDRETPHSFRMRIIARIKRDDAIKGTGSKAVVPIALDASQETDSITEPMSQAAERCVCEQQEELAGGDKASCLRRP